ncbi:GNAT family protein [Adlercreutzia sp. ZJ304]|uniref:GNAT family N-acetyltransferase n=1 Tax=Adlercreutzia sp. ZJ304 TaxID=2709791 RepID=UPI0013EC402A|nr:GNAT family protein [Adlercreutzia sp. ZJ304]
MHTIANDFRYGCLRALRESDAKGMLEWMHDDNIASVFQYNFRSMTLDDVLTFIEQTKQGGLSLHFAIVDANDEYMGTVSLKNIDNKNRNAEYAISTRAKAHGTGIANRATLDVLHYAFRELNLHKVYLNVRTDNVRANRFYEKVGFEFEGTSKDMLCIDDKYYDLNWYGILADNFSHLVNDKA